MSRPPGSARHRAVFTTALLYFVAVFAAMLWPVYPLFGGIRPMILGLPFSLFYQVCLLALSFLVLVVLYRWERRHGGIA
jgi:hypothetical protein